MLGSQSVRVTYAHKKRYIHKKLLSSPLEVLPPDADNLTHTQMTRRMLKRSRRVALAEQPQDDQNIEGVREHIAKRIKHTRERAPDLEPAEEALQDNLTFQTPFPSPSPRSVHDPTATAPKVPEQFSPVPVAKRVLSRTSSRNLKENSAHPQTLASPFRSRPGSATSSPKHKDRARFSRRVSRVSFHAKSRTLSGIFFENARQVSRKESTASLKETTRTHSARHIKHRRYPSSPSTSYMRSQFAQVDETASPKAFARAFCEIPSPGGSIHSDGSFYADQPQSYSTPAVSRLRNLPGPRTGATNLVSSFTLGEDSVMVDSPDIEMMDGTVPPRRQAIHLSGNSIFSSSDEFTIRSLPATREGGNAADRIGEPARVAPRVFARHEAVDASSARRSLAGSFIADYHILPDSDYSRTRTAKLSVGQQPLSLPGTSPVHGENLVRTSRNSGIPKSFIGEQPFSLPGISPACGQSIAHASRGPVTLGSPPSPHTSAPCPPSSPASDLALELQSIDIRGNPDTHSDEEPRRSSSSVPLQTRSRSLRGAPAEPTMKKTAKRRTARNRAGTIRASDSIKPGVGADPRLPDSTSNVRRTRSGTVVGPNSKLAAVKPGTGSESVDELLLKDFWTEEVEYLGVPAPPDREEAEADEMNLDGPWHSLEFGPPRRPGLRKR